MADVLPLYSTNPHVLVFLLHNTPDIKNLFVLVNMPFCFTFLSLYNFFSPALEYYLSTHVLGLLSLQATYSRKPTLITQASQYAMSFSPSFILYKLPFQHYDYSLLVYFSSRLKDSCGQGLCFYNLPMLNILHNNCIE